MTYLGRVLLLSALLASTAFAADDAPDDSPQTPPLADFKLTIELFGVYKPAIARAELVVRHGLAYQFVSDVPDEITIVEPRTGRLRLLDLKRKVQTEVAAFEQLDAALARSRLKAFDQIDAQLRAGGKAKTGSPPQ